jgi:DNA-binding transcriptional ArsR family regulator
MKLNLINSKFDRKNKRFYVSDQVGIKDQDIIALLRQEIPFKILLYLIYPGAFSEADLAKDFKIHPSTIYFHVKKLLEKEIIKLIELKNGKYSYINKENKKFIISVKPVKGEKFYTWKDRKVLRDVYRLLIAHKESMIDSSIIDTLNDMNLEWRKLCGNKKIRKWPDYNTTVDNFMSLLEEIFYFPYHF